MRYAKRIFKVVKNKDFVVLDRGFLSNKDLSAKAKGILAYLLSLPSSWRISVNELSKHFKDGEKSIRSGIKELINAGHIVHEKLRDGEGKFACGVYLVFETPVNESMKLQGGSPHSQNRNVENRHAEKRNAENGGLLNNENRKNRERVNIDKIKIISDREISEAEKEYWKEVLKYRFSKGE